MKELEVITIKLSQWEENESVVIPIAFCTNAHSMYSPRGVRINIEKETIKDIIEVQKTIPELPYEVTSVNMICRDNTIFISDMETMEIEEEWSCDVSLYKVYEDGVLFYAQNKWDSTEQIESDFFIIQE